MSADDPLDPLRAALDEGRAEEVVAGLRALPEATRASSAARALAALALLDLEAPAEAERALGPPPEKDAGPESDPRPENDLGPAPDGDLDWTFARAEVDLARWRLERARDGYAALARAQGDDASLALRRALLCDLEGHRAAADRELDRAARLDPGRPPVPRLGERAFEALVEAALDALPEPFRARLDEVAVVVDPVPDRALASAAPDDTPPDVLGLFVGLSDLERGVEVSGAPGPVIYLFQRNLERSVGSADELAEEVRITLLHEFGHLLGFDEDGVDALGLA